MRESVIQNQIRERVCAECPGIIFRLNSGTAWGGDKIITTPEYGRVLTNPRKVELCPPGTPDLLYLGPGGVTIFLEVKNATGRAREAQENFLSLMHRWGFRAAIVRSPERAVEIINGGAESDGY